MAKPRLPNGKAEVLGANVKDPGRFAGRTGPKRVRPIGEPYLLMTELQKVAWAELSAECPWFNSSHRPLLRLASILIAKLDDAEVGINTMQTLSAVLSKLGATPVDESKVDHSAGETEDPSDKFFGRPN